ncbi:MAG: PIN domain-containing protein [Deltaproteobacteria bacterium]|nr:PIN domain-containing protein [Deltaproteobacteria bacterium]
MILVDTSIWVDLFSRNPKFKLPQDKYPQVVTCSPIIQEVLQGIDTDAKRNRASEGFLALPILANPITLDYFLEASEIYRNGRRRGLTIRSGVDCLIAAIALRHRIPVWHQDRDFSAIAKFTALESIENSVL